MSEVYIYSCKETDGFLDDLNNYLKEKMGKNADLILDYPVVYIHVWQSKDDIQDGKYSIYIGETNDKIAIDMVYTKPAGTYCSNICSMEGE